MSRYPFNDGIEGFLSINFGCSDQQSIDKARNSLQNIGRIFHLLKENGTIQSDNPARMVPNDIQYFVDERRSGGVSESTISRDLSYLDGYLRFRDNCSVGEYLEGIRRKDLEEKRDNSEKALRKIFLHNSRDLKDARMIKAYAFVMLAIVFDIHPDMLRKAKLRSQFNAGLSDYRLQFIDRSGSERDEHLDLNRLPVIERYIDQTYLLGLVNSTPRPLFPSSNPLFDYISPDESRELKNMVEKDIGIGFDYQLCTRIYLDMLQDDSPIRRREPIRREIWIPPMRRRSFFDRILGR